MAGFQCAKCGTDLEQGMKFCRRCGTPVDASEAATRTFDEPARFDAGTHPTNSWPTTPAFAPPSVAPIAQAPATQSLDKSGQKKTVIILASVVAVLLISLIVLAMILLRSSSTPVPTAQGQGQGTVQPPRVPDPSGGLPGPGGLPPPPPAPPGAPPVEINTELYYPGAKVTLETFDARGKAVQLTTSDSVAKVAEWYKAKIAPTNITRAENFVTLTGNGIAVVITDDDDETQIILAHDNGRRGPGR